MSNVNGRYPGDMEYEPFFTELNKRKATVFIHPNSLPGKSDHKLLIVMYFWLLDTTRTMIDFVSSEYHKKFPDDSHQFCRN
jgi:hypothetical protein